MILTEMELEFPYQNIQTGINYALNGDTISISGGVYGKYFCQGKI